MATNGFITDYADVLAEYIIYQVTEAIQRSWKRIKHITVMMCHSSSGRFQRIKT